MNLSLPTGNAIGRHARPGLPAPFSLALATLLCVGCAQPIEHPVMWDSKTAPPSVEPQMVEGKCALMVSGTTSTPNRAISRVNLTVERGLAQIDVDLAPPTQWTSPSFHVIVPIEEQHVSVIYVGATRFPIWERGTGGKDCAR